MIKLLALLAVVAAVGIGFATDAHASNPTCLYVAKAGDPAGYNWGEWDRLAQPGADSSLSVNIAVYAYQTVASPYSHVIGRLGIQTRSGTPQIQTGIWEEKGTAPFFTSRSGAPPILASGGWRRTATRPSSPRAETRVR